MNKAVIMFFVLGVVMSGCYNDNYKELYPAASLASGCDTVSQVTYGKQISSIMNGYCVGCHSESIANGNVKLDTYSGVMSAAASGKLVASITRQSSFPMPISSQLDECSIREVELWIQNNYAQ